jgi:dihydrofolate synthase/folylpolyglutamate synthase
VTDAPGERPHTVYERTMHDLYRWIRVEKLPVHLYQVDRNASAPSSRLLDQLGNPHLRYPVVHVAGTRGKGSTSTMLASCLCAAGLKVGLYTSPHFDDFRERIRVLTPSDYYGRIGKDDVVARYEEVRGVLDTVPNLTWFEIPTALAFLQFAHQHVDVAVVETGIGGRLDATNVVTPIVSVITTLGLDHVDLLGETIEEIAQEKGGIIKDGVPVACAPQPPGAMAVISSIAASHASTLSVVGTDWIFSGHSGLLTVARTADPSFVPAGSVFPLALLGSFQLINATVSVAALSLIRRRFPSLARGAVITGLTSVSLPGRLEVLADRPDLPMLVIDDAVCAKSAEALAEALRRDFKYRRLWLLFGALEGKDIESMMRSLLPLADGVVVAAPACEPRQASPENLAATARRLGFEVSTAANEDEALAWAFRLAQPGDLICSALCTNRDLVSAWKRIDESRVPLTATPGIER